ncbi:MAG: hypothetical protein AUJ52_06710 [Elusimicrobia bacterium CG1_02_63_36]|nr:MAG: hypothetical protein AUJ52_06710 [Elusimicrobia bacterium CG1_02_63_36]PIP83321.1 MAG: hypothetical protein COR54_10165 [Elusimicrobia bacterium CG22_combo_CG10-13_8_21_14_all_63_91]PJA17976.1 MAG: hypothetical protein COX66_02870 [Elusimicrobia bacterium CG_4_10_14_0_2_um_filter_63_34]PJB26403.1 MAG: hypothetical protein CO113_03765 [Elusimicrobia bacterium CG_4_9_14_3_um_filter_62_55]
MNGSIQLEGVVRRFGKREVLRAVTARAEPGKVIGLLGRNGEGKSTLFKILLDMLAADAGRISIGGMSPDGSGRIRQKVGYMPERPEFHGFMTIEEAFALRGRFFEKWDRRRASELAKRLELDVRAPVAGASKGMLGKAAMICALAHNPEILLLDEPTSGLDPIVRDGVLGEIIRELHGSGKTIVVSNHRMEEMGGLIDEVWVLAGGRIVATHEVERLRTEACRLVARAKNGAYPATGLRVVELSNDGPLSEWAAFDSDSADRFSKAWGIEAIEREPLPLETSLKLLLKEADAAASEETEAHHA